MKLTLFSKTKIPLHAADMKVEVERYRIDDPDSLTGVYIEAWEQNCGVKQVYSNGRFITARPDDKIPQDEIHKWDFIGGIE